MKPYPLCRRKECGKSPDLHGLINGKLACIWGSSPKGKNVVKVEADFGEVQPIIVASLINDLGRKVPKGLLDQVLGLKRKGITEW